MRKFINPTLMVEEKRAVILFVWLFYLVSFSYDVFYSIILKNFLNGEASQILNGGLGIWYFVIELLMIPFIFFCLRKNYTFRVKYMIFIVYTLLNFVNDLVIYYGNDIPYRSGSIAELLIVLFSPIFINSRFFWLVATGSLLKYSLLGLILQDQTLLLPVVLLVVVSLIAFILLQRFKAYVNTIQSTFDEQLEGIVKGVVATLELKDPYTRGHSQRVAAYSCMLAKRINGFSSEQLANFNYACLLHDVGKVNIPDSILMKPSRLNNEEFNVIKTHPTVGAEALSGIKGLECCLDVVKYHHERWDGRGYPEGLKGEEIPFLARITAVADAFDAMTSSRSYRPAMSLTEAYSQIIEGEGTQFDPEMVKTFKKVFPEWSAYHKEHSNLVEPTNKGGEINENS
ncbi:HD-GYP domain-containing protein [Alkalihalobacillus sp. CinArs1]|uniref:HD-GYP domain-containing protein n=1 Tax=Alkalihalobacillus sp. CinArs1 TaxID=2995314 RepID=UPI0022DE8D5B|nr:HD-GYP domain-containing protein [Alkalihalobacillus sp. CinArs1]